MVTKQTIIRWHTTPRELRKIADRMEKVWEESCIEGVLIVDVSHGDGVELRILIDQEKMRGE